MKFLKKQALCFVLGILDSYQEKFDFESDAYKSFLVVKKVLLGEYKYK